MPFLLGMDFLFQGNMHCNITVNTNFFYIVSIIKKVLKPLKKRMNRTRFIPFNNYSIKKLLQIFIPILKISFTTSDDSFLTSTIYSTNVTDIERGWSRDKSSSGGLG